MRAIGGALPAAPRSCSCRATTTTRSPPAGWTGAGAARRRRRWRSRSACRAAEASWIAKRLAGFLAPASVEVAYPGLWLRDDVYATHGHYLDLHFPIPMPERLAAGLMARLVGAVPDPATPDDYEAVLAPIYALTQASAQRAGDGRGVVAGGSTVGTWRELTGTGRGRRLRAYALAVPFRLGVLAANRAGLGPVQARIDAGRPAARGPRGDRRDRASPADRAGAPHLRPHPPDRLSGAGLTARVAHAGRDAAAQRGQLALRTAFMRRDPADREPVLARRRGRARRRRAAAPGASARGPAGVVAREPLLA